MTANIIAGLAFLVAVASLGLSLEKRAERAGKQDEKLHRLPKDLDNVAALLRQHRTEDERRYKRIQWALAVIAPTKQKSDAAMGILAGDE